MARERVRGSQLPISERSVPIPTSERSVPIASTLIAGSNPSSPTCSYCQQGHPLNNCRTITDIEECKKILRSTGHCYVCLRRGHMSHSCRSTTRCYKCKGRHHSSICSAKPKEQVHKDPCLTDMVVPTSQMGTDSTSALNLTMANQLVLLQTALTSIYDPRRPQEIFRVRLILDSGSQHSYISSRPKEALHLVPEDECHLAIAAFGSKRSGTQRCEVVRVGVKTHDGPDTELVLSTVPYICEPLSIQPVSLCRGRYDHLSCLELADASDGSTLMEVDLLIGSLLLATDYWRDKTW